MTSSQNQTSRPLNLCPTPYLQGHMLTIFENLDVTNMIRVLRQILSKSSMKHLAQRNGTRHADKKNEGPENTQVQAQRL